MTTGCSLTDLWGPPARPPALSPHGEPHRRPRGPRDGILGAEVHLEEWGQGVEGGVTPQSPLITQAVAAVKASISAPRSLPSVPAFSYGLPGARR